MVDASVDASDAGRDLFATHGIAIGLTSADASHSRIATDDFETLYAAADASLTNAAALRAQLEALGHRFRSTSASDLVLRAYQEWGTRAFARLRGPFACAIWDAINRRLLLARDHIGIRPLYFAVLPNHGVVFASEIRALLRDPGVGRDWCPAGIDAYLTVGYVPAPLTPYRRISKLESAHFLVIDGRRLHVERYWDLPVPDATNSIGVHERAAQDLARALSARLCAIVGEHAGDGTVNGLLYSGGTASTTLLAASRDTRAAVITLSMDEDPTDLVRGGRAASMLGRTRDIEAFTPDVPMLARSLAAHCDEPVGDPAGIAQLSMCLAARPYTDCALSGHGAAALWSGFARHRVE